jgi:hypothetical protein
MPFCYLTQYCRPNTAVHIARIHKVSASPSGIKYKLGIKIFKGTKNVRRIETSYGKKLLRQSLSNLQTIRHSYYYIKGEDIPTGYHKIHYHMVFDIKYDLRHKERVITGGNWTVNKKEDIYSGVVSMNTVGIRFFLGDLYGLLCCA